MKKNVLQITKPARPAAGNRRAGCCCLFVLLLMAAIIAGIVCGVVFGRPHSANGAPGPSGGSTSTSGGGELQIAVP